MTTKVEELKGQITALAKDMGDIATKADAEGRDFTPEERQEVTLKLAEIEGAKSKIVEIDGDVALRKSIEGLGGNVEVERPEAVRSGAKGSIGEQFSAHIGETLKKFPGGISEKHDVRGVFSPFVAGGMKTLITGDSATSGGALVTPANLGLQDAGGLFQRPLTIRDVVTNGTTSSDSVEFVRVTGFTNSASPAAEATATGGASGLKLESALTLARVSEPVRTIAHWVPVTNRALSDAGQIRTIVDNFLRYGLEEELEDQMVNGSGTGENFTGFVKLADDDLVQDQAWSTDLLTTLRKARTLVRTVGRAIPNAYLLNPADTERLDLTQNTTQGNFYFGGPVNAGAMRVWGVPIIESEAVASGVGWVGDFRQAVLWDREQASIVVGTINDQLIRNMVTILCEARAAFGVFRPQAIVRIDLTS